MADNGVYDTVFAFIMKWFENNWVEYKNGVASQITPIAWPNRTIDPTKLKEFVRLFWRTAFRDRELLTANPETGKSSEGLIFVQILVRANTGVERANYLLGKATTLFDEKSMVITDKILLAYFVPEPDELGDDGKGFYQLQLRVPFKITES